MCGDLYRFLQMLQLYSILPVCTLMCIHSWSPDLKNIHKEQLLTYCIWILVWIVNKVWIRITSVSSYMNIQWWWLIELFPQVLHKYGFSPVWKLQRPSNWDNILKTFLHVSHLKDGLLVQAFDCFVGTVVSLTLLMRHDVVLEFQVHDFGSWSTVDFHFQHLPF